MKILLSFTGFHDPYGKSLVGKDDQPGPVLSAVNAVPFDRVILFSTPRTVEITGATALAIESRHHGLAVEVVDLALNDPTDYRSILIALFVDMAPQFASGFQTPIFASRPPPERLKCMPAGFSSPPATSFLLSCFTSDRRNF